MKKPNYLVLILCLTYYVNCGDETIDNTPPTISIVSHISGQSVDDTTIIVASTKDKSGIGSVEFFINDSLYFNDSKKPFEYQWNTAPYENGSEHYIHAISYDKQDNSNSSEKIWLVIDKKELLWGKEYSINTTYLTLPDSGVSGQIPAEIGKFINLIYLDLKNNEIAGRIPSEIGSLTSLEYLDLSNNQLSGEVPLSIRNLVNLRIVKLSNNLLVGVLPDSICNLEEGSVFQINNNNLCPPYPVCVSLIGSQDTTDCN